MDYPGFYEGAYYGNDYGGPNPEEYFQYIDDAFTTGQPASSDALLPTGSEDDIWLFCVQDPAAQQWAEYVIHRQELIQEAFSGLPRALQAIASSEEAKEEAKRIAAAIENTWLNNWKLYIPWAQTVRGYWCYEWAYAFQDAAMNERPTKFKVEVSSAATEWLAPVFCTRRYESSVWLTGNGFNPENGLCG